MKYLIAIFWLCVLPLMAAPIKVALYKGGGSMGEGIPRVWQQLTNDPKAFQAKMVSPADIQTGALSNYDVVIFTGGTSRRQADTITDQGREAVTNFVNGGGGYVGICAGAFLSSYGAAWDLKMVPLGTAKEWRRGRATLKIELTKKGREIFKTFPAQFETLYHNGPVFLPKTGKESAYEPLAFFRTETPSSATMEGKMIGAPAIVTCEFGKGHVLAISPHPEQTDGLELLVPEAVKYVASFKK